MKAKINIIIPVHNRKEHTKKCLESLAVQTYEHKEIIVVDDGSSDGTYEMIAENFPFVKILRGDGNLWWTGAVNLGLSEILNNSNNGEYVLLLNNDLIFKPDYLDKLISHAKRNPNSILGSVVCLVGSDSKIYDGGNTVNWWTAKIHKLNSERRIEEFSQDHSERVSYLTGRGVLFPTKVFKVIGIYNKEKFPHYGDVELTRRANKKGYELKIYYDCVVYTYTDSQPDTITIKDIPWVLSNIKSKRNLKLRFWLSYLMTENILQGTFYFISDLIRIGVKVTKLIAGKPSRLNVPINL